MIRQSTSASRYFGLARSSCMVRHAMQRYTWLVFVSLAAGCATSHLAWRRLDDPTRLKPDKLVWIWGGGELNKWHSVVVTQDSVTGVPYDIPLPCDSCQRSLPRNQIDSMKVSYQQHNVAKEVFVGAGLVFLAILAEAGVCTLIHAEHC